MIKKVLQIHVKPNTQGERGLPKIPVKTGVRTEAGFKGDYNKFRPKKKDSNPDMAVLIYSTESIREHNSEGWPIRPGDLGENLTVSGIPHSHFSAGQQFQINETIIEII